MTSEEAKKQLRELILDREDRERILDKENLKVSDSVKEIYRKDIEALKKALELFEKQIPKKPERGVCPNCNSRHIYAATLTTAECFKHCGDCGQALDWSDNEPTKPKGRRMFSDEQIDRILWEIEQATRNREKKS